jgi:DNA-binding transcriptional ArsR family regulator
MLEEPEKDATDYVEFMLTAISKAAENAKKLFLEKREFDNTDLLLPRRKEILILIREHKMMNFDQLRRRFIKINERTLRYDLKKLQDAKLIKKLGTTRGVYYSADFR